MYNKKIILENLKKSIRDVPDFPKKGILFKDLTTVFKDKKFLSFMIDEIYEYYKNLGITKIVGIESRGFILGTALAYKIGAGFILVRKPNKLPSDTYKKSYDLEYGKDQLEIHKDALNSDDVVLIHDDLLATGGTAIATLDLLKNFNLKKIYVNFAVELAFLKARERFNKNIDIYSLIKF